MASPRVLVAFDLDGTLLDCRDVHFQALNEALAEVGYDPISEEEHLARFDGLPTSQKLTILAAEGRIDPLFKGPLEIKKAAITAERIVPLGPEPRLTALFVHLQGLGIATAVVSNARRDTVRSVLRALGLEPDTVISNEDVRQPKPSPEGYLLAMLNVGACPETTIVLEDAPAGKRAARASGARLVPVFDPRELTVENVSMYLAGGTSFDVIIPMAGDGRRFAEAGYDRPKPLVDVRGEPMVGLAVRTLGLPEGRHVFAARDEHLSRYALAPYLGRLARETLVVPTGRTEGAAHTVLRALEACQSDEEASRAARPVVIANSDQWIDWDADAALHRMVSRRLDGMLMSFHVPDRDPKWSYAAVSDTGRVISVAEKVAISDIAMTGIYVWRSGWNLRRAIRRMMEEDRRVRGEFYVTPTFALGIEWGLDFEAPPVRGMHGLGTPEDLDAYLKTCVSA